MKKPCKIPQSDQKIVENAELYRVLFGRAIYLLSQRLTTAQLQAWRLFAFNETLGGSCPMYLNLNAPGLVAGRIMPSCAHLSHYFCALNPYERDDPNDAS